MSGLTPEEVRNIWYGLKLFVLKPTVMGTQGTYALCTVHINDLWSGVYSNLMLDIL